MKNQNLQNKFENNNLLLKKFNKLKTVIREMKSVLIAYSGGVDSTFLLRIAKDVLGDNVLAVTAVSETYPQREIDFARKYAKEIGVKHIVIETDELKNKEFVKNTLLRCYHCKTELFSKLKEIAKENNINTVLDGSNIEDIQDFRPGMKAGEELGVRSPLKDAELTKSDIRELSKRLGLQTWDKPSFACLSSRIPYGKNITKDKLIKIDEAERYLLDLGLKQVRVRHYNGLARIEIGKGELPKILDEEIRGKIVKKFKEIGYTYITLDLEGYRSGSMNEQLLNQPI